LIEFPSPNLSPAFVRKRGFAQAGARGEGLYLISILSTEEILISFPSLDGRG